jgi:hypothetical protein
MHDNTQPQVKSFNIKQWPRQLLVSVIIIGLLWAYYPGEYGQVIATFMASAGLSKLVVHLIALPITTTALHLGLSGKNATGQYWFILLTWISAMALVFSAIRQPFFAIVSLIPASISFVLLNSALIYYRADKVKRAHIKKGIKKVMPLALRRITRL